ncbi:NfrA family protein [Burkholderia singularis]|uniref:NfrA family protein n=1 Tax=Burkholderia singularis TaxID=1503053 RepID=UPI0009E8C6BE|nr:bacteriophage N4 adsorption protein A [Burkholderia singularis]
MNGLFPPPARPSRTLPRLRGRAALACACAALLGCGTPARAATPDALPLPLAGAAYRVAQHAYDAYDRRDYARAVALAQEAIRQRPDVVQLRRLLANSLAARRQYTPARRALDDAIRTLGPRHALLQRRAQIDALLGAIAQAERVSGTAGDNLAGPAFETAKTAYAAYADKRYADAARLAAQAIALRDDVLRWHLLLIDAANADGQYALAWRTAADATRRFGENEDLRLRRFFIGSHLAPAASTDAWHALERGDLPRARDAARDAVAYAPDAIDYRVELFDALSALGDWPALEAAATDAIAYDNTEPMPYVYRAYARAAQQRFDASDADLGHVFGESDAARSTRNIARAIAADIWIETGRPQRALDALTPLRPSGDDTDALITERIATARRRLGLPADRAASAGHANERATDPARAALAGDRRQAHQADLGQPAEIVRQQALEPLAAHATPAPALPPPAAPAPAALLLARARPIIDCEIDEFGAGCDVSPADPGFAAARASARAAARGDRQAALRHARDAVAAAPASAAHRVELIDALDEAGDATSARATARTMLRDGTLGALPPLEAAYVALRAGDERRALREFRRADAAGGAKLPADALADAGYASAGAWRDADAARYFERAIDTKLAANDKRLAAAQQLDELRAAHAEATRRWGWQASLDYRGMGLHPGYGGAPSAIDNGWQTGIEAYWRPFGSLGDRLFEVYARGYGSFGGDGRGGASTLEAALGARVKPFADLDAIVAFERLVPIGSQARGDWLVRLGYAGGIGTEWRRDVPSWWTVRGYGEAGHYVHQSTHYATGSIEAGRTLRVERVTPYWTVFPHAVIGADYDSSMGGGVPLGAGVGVSTRYAFRDGRYDTRRSFVDLSLQYRWKLAGDDRARGVFFSAIFSY